jgi:hypothetical protein
VSEAWRFPWDVPAPVPAEADPDAAIDRPRRRGRRPVARPAASDWLYHHLTVSGPAAAVTAFANAACGSGVTPWHLDYAAIEEDVFIRAVSQPAQQRQLTVDGCRILARQFREKVEAHQSRAMALVGQNLACPFDLHALLPVPESILQLGPAHPAALAWLTEHWGITDRLRRVRLRDNATTGRRLPAGYTVVGYSFITDREAPDAAIRTIAAAWPALRFRLAQRPMH